MNPDLMAIIANVPPLLAAIVGLAVVAWTPRRSRLLAAGGLALIVLHAALSLFESLVLWQYFNDSIPSVMANALSWLFYLILIVGLGLLALAATAARDPRPAPAPGYAPYPHVPRHHTAPSAAPDPHSGDRRPGA